MPIRTLLTAVTLALVSPMAIAKSELETLRTRCAEQERQIKELEEENRRLKQMYANLSLEHEVLKDIIEKKLSR